jgi:hypothetical protein
MTRFTMIRSSPARLACIRRAVWVELHRIAMSLPGLLLELGQFLFGVVAGDHVPGQVACASDFVASLPSADMAIAGAKLLDDPVPFRIRPACAAGTNGSRPSRPACWSSATPSGRSTRSTGRA